MSVDPALTAPEIAALAGASVPRWGMVYDTITGNTVATAQVNMPGGVTYPLPTLTVDNTSAGWSNVAPGMVILIGSTLGGFDRGIYRVRKAGTSTTLEMMAIGANDSGEVNLALRNTGISDNDYIAVLNRFDVFGAYPRIAYTGIGTDATIYEDWDKDVGIDNRHPAPIVNVVFPNKQSNYATHVYGNSSATFDISLAISLWNTSSGATYTIALPSGWTLNSGSLTGSSLSPTINVTVPHSANSYTLEVEVAENNGNPSFAYRKVWVKSNTYPPITITQFDSDVDDRTGTRATVTFNSLVGMPVGALVHLFDMGNWNGSDVPTARKCITGYVVRRKEVTDIGVTNVSLDIVGPSYLMDQIGGQSQVMSAINAGVLDWQELYYTLSYLDFIIWWVMWQRGRGLLQTFNYTPFGLTDAQKRMTDWRIDAGSLLSQVQALATRYGGGNFGCDATGEFFLQRNLSRIPWSDRSSIPTRCVINASIYHQIELDYDERPHLRRLRGECFVSDGLTTDTPFWCDAPPIPGQGTSEEKLERIIADTEDELLELTGNEYAARNNPYPSGNLTIQKNYAVVKPAQMLPIETDIPAWLRYDGVAYSALQLPTQVTYTHNSDGTIDTQIAFETETVGIPATDVPIPAPDPSLYNSPYQATPFAPLPPYQSPNPNPAGTKAGPRVIPKNGSVGFCGTATQAFLVLNFLGTPQYRNVTPSDLGSFQIKHGIIVTGTSHAYLLGSDGTNSAIWHTSNIFATTVVWDAMGATFSGVFDQIRNAGVAGSVMAYSSDVSGIDTTINFQATNGGLVNQLYSAYGQTSSPNQAGTWVSGAGWEQTLTNNTGSPNTTYESVFVGLPFLSSKTITRIKFVFDRALGTQARNIEVDIFGLLSGSVVFTQSFSPGPTGTDQSVVWTGSQSLDLLAFNTNAGAANSPTDPGGTCTLKSVTYTEGGGNSKVAYSTNFGATATVIDLGSSAGSDGGFDLQRSGTVSYAAANNAILKASTFGGSYSTDQSLSGVQAGLIESPWYIRNSLTALNSGGSPQYIFGLTSPDGSSHTLYWVVSGTPVNITPVIGGNPGIVTIPNCLTTWKGKYIAAVLSFGGVLHLVTSIDGGSTWVDRGVVNAPYVRVRRQSATPGQLFMAGTALDYSPSFGASIISKAKPDTEDLVFYEPVG